MSTYKDFRLSADTSQDAENQLFEMLRMKSPEEKMRMVGRMTAATRSLSMSGLRERYPTESDDQLKLRFVELLYGPAVAQEFSKNRRKESGE